MKYSQIIFPLLIALVHEWNCELLLLFCFLKFRLLPFEQLLQFTSNYHFFSSRHFSSSMYMHRNKRKITSFPFLLYNSYESTNIATHWIPVLLYSMKLFAVIPISKPFLVGENITLRTAITCLKNFPILIINTIHRIW